MGRLHYHRVVMKIPIGKIYLEIDKFDPRTNDRFRKGAIEKNCRLVVVRTQQDGRVKTVKQATIWEGTVKTGKFNEQKPIKLYATEGGGVDTIVNRIVELIGISPL